MVHQGPRLLLSRSSASRASEWVQSASRCPQLWQPKMSRHCPVSAGGKLTPITTLATCPPNTHAHTSLQLFPLWHTEMSENEGSLLSSPSPTVHLLNLNLTTIEGVFSLKVSKRPIPLKSAGIQGAERWCRGVSETAGLVFFFVFWNLKKGLCEKRCKKITLQRDPPSHTAGFRPG